MFMACMSSNEDSTRRYVVDSLQLTNWILDSGETCHMTPEISYFILVSLVKTDKCIELSYEPFFTAKQTGEVQIKIRDNNGKPFVDTLYKCIIGTIIVRSVIFPLLS